MSAQLAGEASSFHARLVLAAGVSVAINAPSMQALSSVVALLQPTEAANEGNVLTPRAATVPAGHSDSPIAAPSAQGAAAQAAGDTGNAASTGTPASAQGVAAGSVQTGEAGNGSAGAPQGASSASTAGAGTSSPSAAVDFDTLKKAFLGLSTKAGGREKCESVLKPFGLPKLSAAKPEQYAAVMAEIEKASA